MVISIKEDEPLYFLDQEELEFFLKGNPSLDNPKNEKPYEWMTKSGWKDL